MPSLLINLHMYMYTVDYIQCTCILQLTASLHTQLRIAIYIYTRPVHTLFSLEKWTGITYINT